MEPPSAASLDMTELLDEIRAMIAERGPITVEQYMQLALAHPDFGYYMNRDPFGATGDFTTAPEISQMFGELVGLWAAEVWSSMAPPGLCRLFAMRSTCGLSKPARRWRRCSTSSSSTAAWRSLGPRPSRRFRTGPRL